MNLLHQHKGVAILLVFMASTVGAETPKFMPAQEVATSTIQKASETPLFAPKNSSAPIQRPQVAVVHEVTAPILNKPNGDVEEKPVDWFTRSLAILGITIGVGNICFALWKLLRDRRLSVEDDFWFRKIIAPATIEPMLKTIVTLLDEAPTKEAQEDDVRKYSLKVTTEFAKLYSSMHTLALFDESLPVDVIKKLSDCEDLLTEYSSDLSQPELIEIESPMALRKNVLIGLNGTLQVIKDRHLKR